VSRAKPKVPKHLRHLARRALADGWEITVTGSGHLRWRPPRGTAVVTGSTPERYGHGPRNARRALARAGLRVRRG
jgi:hypothetical protein